ncbi:MAG: ComEC/Rec2 family competence protein [Chloroflexia bacterium]
MRLVCWTVGWLVGIGIGMRLGVPWFWALAGAIGVLALARSSRDGTGREMLLSSAFLFLGLLRASLLRSPCAGDSLATLEGRSVVVRGVVAGESEQMGAVNRFPFQVEALRDGGGPWQKVAGKMLVAAPVYLAPSYGMRLELQGKLVPLVGGAAGTQRFCVELRDLQLAERIPGTGGAVPLRILYRMRGWARTRLQALFPEPQAALLVGVLLGARTGLPRDVAEAFSRSGTSHILAISGWNITLVVGFLGAGMRFLPRRLSFPLLLGGIAAYTLLVGAGAAVVRAALMGSLYLFARQAGRPADALTALFASAWIMTLWNPRMLFDIGFQLSCSATLGMLLFVPIWAQILHRWPSWLGESTAATLSSQLLTWPIVAWHFRTFSLVVPLANLVACPALAPLMLLGALALCLGRMPLLGALVCGAAWVVASYMLGVVRWTGALPWAAFSLPALGPSFLLAYYGALGVWWYHWHCRPNEP